MITRRLLLSVLAAACFVAISPAKARADAAVDFVQNLAKTAVVDLTGKDINDEERAARFRKLLLSNFDLPSVSRFVLARHWQQANEAQRKEFLRLFEEVTVLTWARRFRDYAGQSLDVGKAQAPDESGVVTVDSSFRQADGPPIIVAWRLRQTGSDYKIVDIVVENVSMAITQRSDFTAVIQRQGMDGLLTALGKKVEDMKAGKVEPAAKTAGAAKN